VRLPDVAGLPEALALARSMRPFRRRQETTRFYVLDEAKTAERLAASDIWLPFLTPGKERWLSASLVIDTGASMAIWETVLREFCRILETLGAFRKVEQWWLDTEDSTWTLEPDSPTPLYATKRSELYRRRPLDVVDPSGRRFILVISDCVSDAWRDGRVTRLLGLWGRTNHTAILQMLPSNMWLRTAVGPDQEILLRSPRAVCPNSRIDALVRRKFYGLAKVSEPGAVSMPVLELSPHSVAAWAQWVIQDAGGMLPGRLLGSRREDGGVNEDDAWTKGIGQPFLTLASGTARELANIMAVAPPFNLPLLRVIRESMLGGVATQVHEAEFLLGGLVKIIEGRDLLFERPDQVLYDFRSVELRKLFRSAVPFPDALRVMRIEQVSRFLGRRLRHPTTFPAFMRYPEDHQGALELDSGAASDPIARFTSDILQWFGGPYPNLIREKSQPSEPEVSSQIRGIADIPPAPASIEQDAAWVLPTVDPQDMLRVRIVGSIPSKSPQQEAFCNACRDIGEELVRRGHVLVISSANERVADYHAFLGYVAAQRAGHVVFSRPWDRRAEDYAAHLEQQILRRRGPFDKSALHAIAGALAKAFDRDSFLDLLKRFQLSLDLSSKSWQEEPPLIGMVLSALNLAEQTGLVQQLINAACETRPLDTQLKDVRERYFRPTVSLDRQIAHDHRQWSEAFEQGILKSCHAAILVGGKTNTRAIWRLAANTLPYVAVPSFGGTAASVWPECKKSLRASGIDQSRLDQLDATWEQAHARVVIDIVEQGVAHFRDSEGSDVKVTPPPPAGFDHVLWVDDRPNNNTSERMDFEEAGLHFTLALSTAEALVALAGSHFAAIISDMRRREGPREGYVLLDAMRQAGYQTPLGFYAGSNNPAYKAETRRRGGHESTNNMDELSRFVIDSVFDHYLEAGGQSSDDARPADLVELKRFLDRVRQSSGLTMGMSLSPLLRIETPIQIADPPLQFGRWVTSRERHLLDPTPHFRLGIYPVRNLDYEQFVNSGGYEDRANWRPDAPVWGFRCQDDKTYGPSTWGPAGSMPTGTKLHPVSGVSFYEADAFCRWLNRVAPRTGSTWQLPTENMWEYAARLRFGSTPTRYPWGDSFGARLCNCTSERRARTSDVGEFHLGNTPDGCTDMAGNVWEFVESSDLQETCVLRGGSFRNNDQEVRADLRLWGVPLAHRPADFGFRCALVRVSAEPVLAREANTTA